MWYFVAGFFVGDLFGILVMAWYFAIKGGLRGEYDTGRVAQLERIVDEWREKDGTCG